MSKTHDESVSPDTAETVRSALADFLLSIGRTVPDFTNNTDLIAATEATSDEGVDFAIDLQDVLGVDVPTDFNPFVHESGKRGRKFSELVASARQFVSEGTGGTNATE